MESVVLSLVSAGLANMYFPSPHMDEIFHVRQLEVYLKGDYWNWDPKITTLPGLYFISFFVFKVSSLHLWFKVLYLCRFFNALLSIPLFYLVNSINPDSASLIMGFPPVFMSSFLYYTDNISLLTTVFCFSLRRKSKLLAFIIALLSVLCRQTNIIWIGYMAGLELIKEYKIENMKDLKTLLINWKQILKDHILDILLVLIFFCFVYWNKGIVVGDRDSHPVKPHLSQLCYLFLIGLLYVPFSKDIKKSIVSPDFVLSIPVFSFFIHNFSYAHPYLLSDNTHYTFYIWKDILNPFGKLLIPFYALGFSLMKEKKLEFFWWIACSSLVLVPAYLLEPRYFITPLSFFLLTHKVKPSAFKRLVIFLLNLSTLAIFLFKPYKSVSFMW